MLVSPAEESRLGLRAWQQVLRSRRLVGDPAANGALRRVGLRIARAAKRADLRWEFAVFDAPGEANAFALPGGKVGVFSGLFPVASDDNGLAVVVGHEVAHVLARHGAERMSQALATQAGAMVIATLLGGGPSTYIVLQAYGVGVEGLVLLPYSRTQEAEADRIGLVLMAGAGYDPRGALAFWKRMEQCAGGEPPEFLSTHPSHGHREQLIRKFLTSALARYARAPHALVRALPTLGARPCRARRLRVRGG